MEIEVYKLIAQRVPPGDRWQLLDEEKKSRYRKEGENQAKKVIFSGRYMA